MEKSHHTKMKMKDLKLFRSPVERGTPRIGPKNDFTYFDKQEIEQSAALRFEKQVAKYPDNLAVKTGTECFTYRRLNEYSNRIAWTIIHKCGLHAQGVALLFEHGGMMITGIFGALKAGKYYIPLDPAYPFERLEYILLDSDPRVLVTNSKNREMANVLIEKSRKDILLIDVDQMEPGTDPGKENPLLDISPHNPAYILYTSGSTGRPKGVLQNQRNMLHFARVYTNALHINPQDRLTLFSSYSFDAAKMDIYGALLNGAALYPYVIKEEGNLFRLPQWISDEDISIYHSIPTVYRYFTENLKDSEKEKFQHLRLIVLGGEAVFRKDIEIFKRYFPDQCILINGLGPTESTVTLQYFADKNTEMSREAVPVGNAVEDTEVLLLDEAGKETMGFGIGELVFKSDFLACGYINNWEKTSEVFGPNPLTGKDRVYRSGDLGRRLVDGTIEYAGRKDFQVKIRGYRVEIGEIEAKLDRCDGIKKSAIICVRDRREENFLIAYYLTQENSTVIESDLVRQIKESLPDYMVPAAYYRLDKFPLTATGKIDRQALKEMSSDQPISSAEYIEPSTYMEVQLADLWKQLLMVDRVGLEDNFFVLGGNSLKAIMMTSQIHKTLEVRVPLGEVFRKPTVRELAHYIDENATKEKFLAVQPSEEMEYYPLSSPQKRLFVLWQIDPSSTAYNMSQVVPLPMEINKEKLELAFNKLIRRHESLRTCFLIIEGEPAQRIYPSNANEPGDFFVEYDPAPFSLEIAIKNFIRPFDLSKTPLVRVGLVKISQEHCIIMIDMHHIITDAQSNQVMTADLIDFYNDRESLPLRVQYKDYVQWQNSAKGSPGFNKQENFWLNKFSTPITPLDLPQDYSCSEKERENDYTGARNSFIIDEEKTHTIRSLSKNEGTTLYMLLLSIFNILLAKLTGNDEIIVGTPIAGRSHPDLQPIIGMFVNTLVLKNSPFPHLPFKTFAKDVKQKTLEAFENQDYPFDDLVEKIPGKRQTGRNPLFDIMFSFNARQTATREREPVQKTAESPAPKESSLSEYLPVTSKFDLMFNGWEAENYLSFMFEYRTILFSPHTIRRFFQYLLNIVSSVVQNPNALLSQIDLLSQDDKKQILLDFNQTHIPYPSDKTIPQLFLEHVHRVPDTIAAVEHGSNAFISYKELNRLAGKIAAHIRAQGVRPDSIAGLMVERSIDMILAIMGILKSGAAYLPIDPGFPPQRIDYMMKDSAASLIVTAEKVRMWTQSPGEEDFQEPASDGSDLAYIIYTSGTTGKPKGVLTTHANVVRVVRNTNYIDLTPHDRLLQLSNYAFDGSVFDIFGALVNGGALVMIEPEDVMNVERLAGILSKQQITVFFLTTALFNAIADHRLEALRYVKKILFGGERISIPHTRKAFDFLGPGRIIHVYGPTETTVFATYYFIDHIDPKRGTIPIGKPLANTTAFILDKQLNPVPIGAGGELYIGGYGSARGYLNNPELSAERFVLKTKTLFEKRVLDSQKLLFTPHGGDLLEGKNNLNKSFCGGPGGDFHEKSPLGTLYKTGDLVRWLEDGNIEFLGRMDRQVKLRGFRVELGEIESRLVGHPVVKEAVVLDMEGDTGEKFLCGYIVPKPGIEKDAVHFMELKEFLSQSLPDFMVPPAFIVLDRIPLNPSGKVDRKALPKPGFISQQQYVPPQSRVEKLLVETWSEILYPGPAQTGRPPIGIKDNFFELGGHSLKATAVASRIHKIFDVKIPLKEIFQRQTIAGLAGYIEESVKEKFTAVEPAEEKEYYLLSYAQKRLFFLQQMNPDSIAYNMPQVIPLNFTVDKSRLIDAFKALILRHHSLRTSFHIVDNEPVQRVHDDVLFDITEFDPGVSSFVRPFDLSIAPLLHVFLVQKSTGDNFLLVDLHHIINDGISQGILSSEFIAFYSGAGNRLPHLKLQYKDYAQWQSSRKRSESMQRQESWWLEQLCGDIPVLELPLDFPRPPVKRFDGDYILFYLDETHTQALRSAVSQEGGSLYMILLALVSILLHKLTAQEDLLIGTPTSGRNHADLQPIVGMFVNTLVTRHFPEPHKTFRLFLKEVVSWSLDAFENQDYPFEELVEKVYKNRDAGRNPLFDVMFVLQNLFELRDSKPKPRTGNTPSEDSLNQDIDISHVSKFDLTFTALEIGDRISFAVEYSTLLFKSQSIRRWGEYFLRIIHEVIQNPDQSIAKIQVISEGEKNQILDSFNPQPQDFPYYKTIHRLFTEQAEQTPDSIALVSVENVHLSYSELNRVSGRLAYSLRQKGITTNTIVGIMMERSIQMVVGIIGILKSGSAYLPIDPDLPQDRIDYILKDSSAALLLTADHVSPLLQHSTIPDLGSLLPQNGETYPQSQSTDLAYIIYTSGTTGKPKGVMVEHKGIANLKAFWTLENGFGVNSRDHVLQFANITFDASVTEFFMAFFCGAALYLVTKKIIEDYSLFEKFIQTRCITVVTLPPPYLTHLEPSRVTTLRKLVTAGSETNWNLLNTWKEKVDYINAYGPTEITICASCWRAADASQPYPYLSVPIGSPIINTIVFILDKNRHFLPVGIVGELYIGGAGLSRGYLNNPGLTAEKFLNHRLPRLNGFEEKKADLEFVPASPDSFVNSVNIDNTTPNKSFWPHLFTKRWAAGGSLYKTGDLGRWLPDGNIEFLGRIDRQVKIRGFRVELNEIEYNLSMHPEITQAVMIVHTDNENREKYICAYYISARELSVSHLREFLSKQLPAYMIPSYFMRMEKIPLTSSGKVDLRALPEPGLKSEEAYTPPRNKIETVLVKIWAEVLSIHHPIGIDDNFFHLGGHSLKAAVLAFRLEKEFKTKIPVGEIFKHPTIRRLGEYIQTLQLQISYTSHEDEKLVLLRAGDNEGKPSHLFFIHDGSGEIHGYIELSRYLNPRLTCWGIRVPRFPLTQPGPKEFDIRRLASLYVETIKTVQVKGPYCIAGWSLGGIVAFEIARLLESQGETVSHLILIDAPPPHAKEIKTPFAFSRESELNLFYELLPQERGPLLDVIGSEPDVARLWESVAHYLESKNTEVKDLNYKAIAPFLPGLPFAGQMPVRQLFLAVNIIRSLHFAWERYSSSQKIRASIHYFEAQEGIAAGNNDRRDNEKNKTQIRKQWSKLSKGKFDVFELEGDHFSIFREPQVRQLAEWLNRVLVDNG